MNSKLSREKVQWLHDAAEEAAAVGIKLTMNPNELLMFTSALLAAMDSEPVAWRLEDSPESSVTVTDNEKMAAIWRRNGRNVHPLYATAHSSTDAVGMVVSEGRQPSAHNPESKIFEVLAESGYEPVPGDKLYRHSQPAPVVPEEMPCGGAADDYHDGYQDGWNACRAAMLQTEPVTTANKLGNSPVIPDGYVMVPKEPTQAMCAAFNDSDYGRKSLRERFVAMLAAAPQEVKP